jgi:hypothetical protein
MDGIEGVDRLKADHTKHRLFDNMIDAWLDDVLGAPATASVEPSDFSLLPTHPEAPENDETHAANEPTVEKYELVDVNADAEIDERHAANEPAVNKLESVDANADAEKVPLPAQTDSAMIDEKSKTNELANQESGMVDANTDADTEKETEIWYEHFDDDDDGDANGYYWDKYYGRYPHPNSRAPIEEEDAAPAHAQAQDQTTENSSATSATTDSSAESSKDAATSVSSVASEEPAETVAEKTERSLDQDAQGSIDVSGALLVSIEILTQATGHLAY